MTEKQIKYFNSWLKTDSLKNAPILDDRVRLYRAPKEKIVIKKDNGELRFF